MTETKKFLEEYTKLIHKYNLDFLAYVECKNFLLKLIIRLFGKHAKLTAKMIVTELQQKAKEFEEFRKWKEQKQKYGNYPPANKRPRK